MRHAFGKRSDVSFRTATDTGTRGQSPQELRPAMTSVTPPMTSASIETFVGDDEQPAQRRLLREMLPEARFFGGDEIELAFIAEDARECNEGDLVVYRIGEGDPTVLIADAMARGAAGIITEQMLPCPLPQCIVGSVDHAKAKIASVANETPDRRLLTVGVLGTSGKTSTCLLAATLTKALGIRTAYQCDLGSSDGVLNATSSRSVPVGANLIEWIAEAGDCMSRVALVEINDIAARDGHYDAMHFDVLIVTGKRNRSEDFGPCGLNCLIDRLAASGIVIAPSADAKTIRVLEEASCQYVTYGTTADSEFAAIMVDQSGGMSTMMITAGDTSAIMETPLCGQAMAANISAVAALGALLGHSPHEIAKHLVTLRSIPGRGQRLVDFGHATVVLETGGAVERLAQSLRTARETGVGGRVWCVLSIGEDDRDEDLVEFGQTIERFADHCIVASQPDQTGSFLKRSHQVLDLSLIHI